MYWSKVFSRLEDFKVNKSPTVAVLTEENEDIFDS